MCSVLIAFTIFVLCHKTTVHELYFFLTFPAGMSCADGKCKIVLLRKYELFVEILPEFICVLLKIYLYL